MSTAIVTATNLNLRDAPNGTILAQLSQGTEVDIIGEHGTWVHVSVNGFVSARYLQKTAGGIAAPEASIPAGGTALSPVATLPPDASPNDIAVRDGSVFGPGGVRFGKLHSNGLYNIGTTSVADYITSARSHFEQMPPSLLRVMEAVSANEGRLEAVNTWDNAFMTFGCFQWTIGTESHPGELPYVMSCLKRSYPEAYQEHFGRHGLDVVGDFTPRSGALTTGFLSLNGQRLDTPQRKGVLRQSIWAYRFWRAGHDDAVRRTQLECAAGRLMVFYRRPHALLANRSVSDYFTSEYGVALILDQHVNRPGHVPKTLAEAISDYVDAGGSVDPETWDDTDEHALIVHYLDRRRLTSMTDSDQRAERIALAIAAGRLSSERGSFIDEPSGGELTATAIAATAGGAAVGAAAGGAVAGPVGAALGGAVGALADAAIAPAEPALAAAPPESGVVDPDALSWRQFQEALRANDLYQGTVDGVEQEASWRALEARFAHEATAGQLADGWESWTAARRKLAVEQMIIRDAGIEVGKIDGLLGPQTMFAREAFQHLKRTGRPLVIAERDEIPAMPMPAITAASRWPRQAECERFYGPVGQNQTLLVLPYRMRLAWDLNTSIRRFQCHEKVHDAFLRVFQKTLDEYGETRIAELRLDLFGGCLNVRQMRGGSQMSMHSWGIAVDLDPVRNQLKMTRATAAFARPEYEPFWKIVEGEGLISLGRVRDFDWMHFQAARL